LSFLSERSPSQMIGGVIAFLVFGLIVRAIYAGGIVEYFDPAKRIENRLVEALEQRPGDAAVLAAMKAHFPLDYESLLDDMSRSVGSGAGPREVAETGAGFLRRFMHNHRNDFSAAPSPNLETVLAGEVALLRQLAEESPVACDDYVKGRLQYDDPLSQEAWKLLGESGANYVEAMAAGRRDQQLRLATTPADLRALGQTLAERGASREQLAALDAGDFSTIGYDEQCDAALRLVEAIDAQPEDRQALLVASFLAPA
jgi:hypothetical protein